MDGERNTKSKIWIYAVVLFSSAFIVLLLTAYSQIKMNENLNNYKNRISDTENEKNKFKLNFSSAQETNQKLKEENEKLNAELELREAEKINLEKQLKLSDEYNSRVMQEYSKLSSAQINYLDQNFVLSATILVKQIDSSVLDTAGKELYGRLLELACPKAVKVLYNEGYELFENKAYNQAIEKFTLALEFSRSTSYTDAILYFMGLSKDRTGKVQEAVAHMAEIMLKYPDGSYYKRAKSYYEKHQQ